MHSKNSECIPNILAHSCGQPECFTHAKNIRGAFEAEKCRTALDGYSICTLTAFLKGWSHEGYDRLRRVATSCRN